MPSYKCIRCSEIYTKGQPTRCQNPGGHCQRCKRALAEQEGLIEDLEGRVRAGKDNIKIHEIQIRKIDEKMKLIEGVQETVKEELLPQGLAQLEIKLDTKIRDMGECTTQQNQIELQKMKVEMEAKIRESEERNKERDQQFQLELQKMKIEMETKIRESEERTKERDQQFQLELQKLRAQQSKEEAQSKVQLAQIEAQKQIEIAKLQANANVAEKKELNKALDKLNKSKSTAAVAFLHAFSSNTPRSNSIADDEPIDYSSLGDNSYPTSFNSDVGSGRYVDAPTEDDNVRWTKVHKSAPLKGIK